jgi:hypothetical protein
MTAYHQMGHDSRNLLGNVSGYRGAVVSPVNEVEADVLAMVEEHGSSTFEFIFDPQLYFPRRSDRGQLGSWSYFPKDFDTADMTSAAWWAGILDSVGATAARVGAKAVCSPAVIAASMFTNEYYETMRSMAERLREPANQAGLRVLQTVIAKVDELAAPNRPFEIASVVSNTTADGIYLVLLSDVKPRDELRDVDQLKGAMILIHALEAAGLPVLVGCCSSDVLLWKAAGATSCATGKFANLRRFTPGRFNQQEDGGRQMPYWFEEALLGFLRASDLPRVQAHGIATTPANPFGDQILAQMASDPSKPWVGLGWRQYMHWFADVEKRLASGATTARALIRTAEENWSVLESTDVFMEEKANDGTWLRPWLRAVVEFNK